MRWWKPAAVVILFAALGDLPAQSSYVIVDSIRLPAESFVGDPVELRYSVRSQAPATVPDSIPQPEWGDLAGVRIEPASGGFELRLTVTPYNTGTLTLPALDLGGLTLDGLSVVVSSVLETDDFIRSALGPRPLPGTAASFVLLGLVAAFVLAAVLYGFGPGRRHIASLLAWYRARRPYKKLLECVDTLDRDIKRYTIRDFYIRLMDAILMFVDSRMAQNCRAATSTELVSMLPELEQNCGAVAGTAAPLEEVFQAADNVKFAGLTVRRKKRTRHLVVVRAVAVELESHRVRFSRARRRAVPEVERVGV